MKETTTDEKVTEMKDRAVANVQEAAGTVSTKLGAVKDTIVDGAKSAGNAIVDLKDRVVEKLVDAKDWTAEKAANPEKTLTEVKESVAAGTRTAGGKLDDVKVWTAEKAKQVDEMFDKGQAFLQLLSEKIDHLKEWTEEKAKAAAEGLGTAKGLLGQVGDTMYDAQCWTDERAMKAGETLDKAKEVLVKTERILENKADTVAVDMKTRSALIHEEIEKLEATMHARGQALATPKSRTAA